MRARSLPRIVRLRDVRTTPHGHTRLAACQACKHSWPLPVAGLLRENTELTPLHEALQALSCSKCGAQGYAQALLEKRGDGA